MKFLRSAMWSEVSKKIQKYKNLILLSKLIKKFKSLPFSWIFPDFLSFFVQESGLEASVKKMTSPKEEEEKKKELEEQMEKEREREEREKQKEQHELRQRLIR
jgi:hypothetical protein